MTVLYLALTVLHLALIVLSLALTVLFMIPAGYAFAAEQDAVRSWGWVASELSSHHCLQVLHPQPSTLGPKPLTPIPKP